MYISSSINKLQAFIALFLCLLNIEAQADQEPFETKESLKYSYKDREERIKIEVELEKLDPKQIKEEVTDGEITKVSLKDRVLPEDMLFYNNPTLVKSFKIWLNGKQVKFPENKWNDVPGFRLYAVKPNIDLKKQVNIEKYHDFVESLSSNPKVLLSDDEKTLLVSWPRREDGDVATIFRWIIDIKTGHILRHGEIPAGDF